MEFGVFTLAACILLAALSACASPGKISTPSPSPISTSVATSLPTTPVIGPITPLAVPEVDPARIADLARVYAASELVVVAVVTKTEIARFEDSPHSRFPAPPIPSTRTFFTDVYLEVTESLSNVPVRGEFMLELTGGETTPFSPDQLPYIAGGQYLLFLKPMPDRRRWTVGMYHRL